MRDQTSAADGFIKALEKARHDLVVFAQQDIYLPRGWDSQFRRQFHEAERQLGSVGVAGVFCYRFGPEGKTISHAWFIGYAPAENPQVAFAVMVEYGGSGGYAAGGVANGLIDACIDHGYLTPTNPAARKVASAAP